MLITFLDGLWVRRPNIKHCHALGDALAHFHLAGADFPMFRANDLSLPGWRSLVQSIGAVADEVIPGLAPEIEKELARSRAALALRFAGRRHPCRPVRRQCVLPRRQGIGADRFHFACNDTLAYDVAICLNAWCFESDGSFNVTKARALLQAYEGVRPLSDAD